MTCRNASGRVVLRRRSPSAHFGFNRRHSFLVQPRSPFRHESCGCRHNDSPRRRARGIKSAGPGVVCPFRVHRRALTCMRDLQCARRRAVRSRVVDLRNRRSLAEYGVRASDCMDSMGRRPVQRDRTALPDHDAGAPGIFQMGALVACGKRWRARGCAKIHDAANQMVANPRHPPCRASHSPRGARKSRPRN